MTDDNKQRPESPLNIPGYKTLLDYIASTVTKEELFELGIAMKELELEMEGRRREKKEKMLEK